MNVLDNTSIENAIKNEALDAGIPMRNAKHSVPGEAERPCYRVFDSAVGVGGECLRAGVWYFGVRYSKKPDTPPSLTQSWVCSPLYIEAVTTDEHNGNFGRLIKFQTSLGQWRKWAMPMELLRADGADLRGELLYMGLEIDPSGHSALSRYLQSSAPEKKIRCVTQTGWATSKAYVLPDEVIGPDSDGVTYQTGIRSGEGYAVAGSLAQWKSGVSALAIGNPILAMALSTAFAGPVLKLVGVDSGGVHFVGDSSTGKTAALDAACSVWGDDGYRRTWRATGNGMEGVATLFNDALLALDEISECDGREVGSIIYSLGNGRGKQRASRTGAARALNRWRCSLLSSGERSVATTMAENNQRQKAGQSVRLLDVPVKRTYGAWDDLHGYDSGAAFSDALKSATKCQHGHAGPAFVKVLAHNENLQLKAPQELERIKSLPEFAANDGQATRAATRFAVLALAGEMATECGITGWRQGDAIAAAAQCFSLWKAQRGLVGANLESMQALESVSDFIDRHGDSRFSPLDASLSTMVTRDRAGWRNFTGHYLFTPSGLREALAGIDVRRGLDALAESGVLSLSNGSRRQSRRINGEPVKCYVVDAVKLKAALP